jgi:hypothetical protein
MISIRVMRIPGSVVLMVSCAVVAGCQGTRSPALTQLVEARHVAAALHVQLVKASDASDRAVLADSDEESVTYARQARTALQEVQTGLGELGTLLHQLGYADESARLDELAKTFDQYRKADEQVLALAVENTNLKAQRLSFGPVRDAADAFRGALATFAKTVPAKERCRADGEVSRAVLAVREIQIEQAPHIAEADEAAMGRMEKEMAAREVAAHDALAALGRIAKPGSLDAATAELERFQTLSRDLVALSRRNTNVRSLSLALRQLPKLSAASDETLTAVEQALGKRGFSGTR